MNDKATILAVDDAPGVLRLLVTTLAQAGYDVRSAKSGELALAAVATSPPDLVLLDVRMEGLDGLDVCRQIKARPETRHIPVILISGAADVRDWVEGMRAGAADFINKPFLPEELLTRVGTHLALRQVQTSLERQTAELRQTNEQLQAEIRERQTAEQKVGQSLDQAERSRRALLSALEDQKRTEAELKKRNAFVETILANAPIGFAVNTIRDGRTVFVGHTFEQIYGLSPNSVHSADDFFEKVYLDPAFREQIRARIAADMAAGDPARMRWEDIPITTATGEQKVVTATNIPLLEQDLMISTVQDVTERWRAEAERQKLEDQLRASQQLEAIGSLAGGVAHDFNNMLSVILSYTAFALENVGAGDPVRNDLQEVQKAANRAVTLTRHLLAFGRKQVLQPVPLDLNQIVLAFEKMLMRIVGEDVEFVHVLAPDLGLTMADPGQIEQVTMILVVNAREAMPKGGRLTIETCNVQIDEGDAARHAALNPGSYVQLAVTDTGSGMDSQTRARIFEPFFTTKEKGRGTGLGLSTAYGILTQSGGNIGVESEPGRGTTFRIYLPRTCAATATAPERPTVLPRSTGTETVLVVDDEEELVKIAQRTLHAAGYTVLAAGQADEAIRTGAEHAGDIHLLVTDVIMPRMNGKALAHELSKTRPTLKVLYMSGYTDDAISLRGVLEEGTYLLGKPFTAAELTRKVREVLDGGIAEPAEGAEQVAADAEIEEQPFDKEALRALSPEILGTLRAALIAARYDEILEIVETIGKTHPGVATRLRRMAVDFDYDGMRELLSR